MSASLLLILLSKCIGISFSKYITGIVTSDGTYSVSTMGVTPAGSRVTYGGASAAGTPVKLAVDRTWKIKDDEGNDWYVPLFKYG